MTIRVELNPEIEARLKAEARAKGIPLEKVAEQLLKEALTGRALSQGQMSVEESIECLTRWRKGLKDCQICPPRAFRARASTRTG
jgi:hypothetical protein